MNAEKAVSAILRAAAGLTTIPIRPWQSDVSDTGDRITYFRVDGQPNLTMTGAADPESARIQVDCWSATYAGAHSLAALVRTALENFRGTAGGVTVAGVILESDADRPASPRPGETLAEYCCGADYIVWVNT
jgi:hypothetical protein